VTHTKQGANAPKSPYSEHYNKHQVKQMLHCISFAPSLEHGNESNEEQSNRDNGKNLQHELPSCKT